jgi:hypothetical protein
VVNRKKSSNTPLRKLVQVIMNLPDGRETCVLKCLLTARLPARRRLPGSAGGEDSGGQMRAALFHGAEMVNGQRA